LVVKNRIAFEARYGTGLPIAGQFVGQLDNSGEHIAVVGAMKEPILDFTYSDDWLKITDGPGFSLALADETITPDKLNLAWSWRAGAVFNGTPGAADAVSSQFPTVVINEALTRPLGSAVAAVELKNLSSSDANISGWFMSDDFTNPKKFRVPSPTIIPAGGFKVFTGNDFRSIAALQPFALDPLGEEIYLFSGDAQTNLTGYLHGFKYGVQKTNDTVGRFVSGAGKDLFVTQQSASIGSENTGPAVPPIVVNEIMYHPPDLFANGAYWNDSLNEYIEVYNRSAAAVQLFDPAHATNSWKISGGAKFTFPPGATLDAGAYALIVSFDPAANPTQLAAFQQKYGVPAGAKIYGPFDGSLNNGGETITLSSPDAPLADGTVPYLSLEEINYDNKAPWPIGADGASFALVRRDSAKFGNDPGNWMAGKPTPAADNAVQLAPAITQQPASQTAPAGQTIRLSVAATGQNLGYQWRFNGENIRNATASSLVLSNAQPAQSGAYAVVVFNSFAATSSDIASVSVGRDYDRDGIEDNWELDRALNPFIATDAALDSDNDGISNLQEYMAGTEPRDATSYLAVEQITVAGPGASLSFNAAPNRTYTIQYTDSLTPANWVNLKNINGGGEGATGQIADQPSKGVRFYRIVTPAQP
jgi:hypothetical protein